MPLRRLCNAKSIANALLAGIKPGGKCNGDEYRLSSSALWFDLREVYALSMLLQLTHSVGIIRPPIEND